jgi:hypothetical protein
MGEESRRSNQVAIELMGTMKGGRNRGFGDRTRRTGRDEVTDEPIRDSFGLSHMSVVIMHWNPQTRRPSPPSLPAPLKPMTLAPLPAPVRYPYNLQPQRVCARGNQRLSRVT